MAQVLQKGGFEEKPFQGATLMEGNANEICQRRPYKTSTFLVSCFLSLHICRVFLDH